MVDTVQSQSDSESELLNQAWGESGALGFPVKGQTPLEKSQSSGKGLHRAKKLAWNCIGMASPANESWSMKDHPDVTKPFPAVLTFREAVWVLATPPQHGK